MGKVSIKVLFQKKNGRNSRFFGDFRPPPSLVSRLDVWRRMAWRGGGLCLCGQVTPTSTSLFSNPSPLTRRSLHLSLPPSPPFRLLSQERSFLFPLPTVTARNSSGPDIRQNKRHKNTRDFSHSSKVGGGVNLEEPFFLSQLFFLLQTHTHVPQTREKKRGNKVYVLPHQAGSLFLLSYPQREENIAGSFFSLCLCNFFVIPPPAPSKKGNRKSSILHSCQISR